MSTQPQPAARPRPNWTLGVALAAVAAFLVAWDGMLTYDFTDYQVEVQPALDQLRDGHVAAFLTQLPPYGGSLVLRAPFAVVPKLLWGGGALAMFRIVALPCVLAGVALGLHLWGVLEREGRRRAAVLAVLLAAANPMSLRAFEFGHPEEVLGGALCVAAVLLALADRATLAGLCLGLASANKAWGVLAALPVLLALERKQFRCLVSAGLAAVAVMSPIVIAAALDAGSSLTTLSKATAQSGPFFHPWQLWWFLGHHGDAVPGLGEAKAGYRVGPGWVSQISHPLIVAAVLPLSLAWLRARRAHRGDALLLFALVMFVRCELDTWDNDYYAVPFLFALMAWEAVAVRRAPWLAALAALALWTQFDVLHGRLTPDAEALAYAAMAIPLTLALGARLYAPERLSLLTGPLVASLSRRLPTLARLAGAGGA